jgi:transposase InsO family protein
LIVVRRDVPRATSTPSVWTSRLCADNAVAESFFATLELELIMKHRWATRDDARRAIFRFIEGWHDRERRHSQLRQSCAV